MLAPRCDNCVGSKKNTSIISKVLSGKGYLLCTVSMNEYSDPLANVAAAKYQNRWPEPPIGKWITSVRYCYAAQSLHNGAYAKVKLFSFVARGC